MALRGLRIASTLSQLSKAREPQACAMARLLNRKPPGSESIASNLLISVHNQITKGFLVKRALLNRRRVTAGLVVPFLYKQTKTYYVERDQVLVSRHKPVGIRQV